MLDITPSIFEALATDALLRKLHRFLSDRVKNASVRALLADQTDCVSYWKPLHNSANDDYVEALRLTVALAARARGEDPLAQLLAVEEAADLEHRAKEMLEVWGIVRYSEFDIE